ncbi:hypothetical protein ACXYMU_16880 [Pontibacter sp. CAU 1760]
MSEAVANLYFRQQRSFAEIKHELLGKFFGAWYKQRDLSVKSGSEERICILDLECDTEDMLHSSEIPGVSSWNRLLARHPPTLQDKADVYLNAPSHTEKTAVAQPSQMQQTAEETTNPFCTLNSAAAKRALEESLSSNALGFVFADPFRSSHTKQLFGTITGTKQVDMLLLLRPETLVRALAGKKISPALTEVLQERLSLIKAFCQRETDVYRRQTYMLQHLLAALRHQHGYTLLFQINHPETFTPLHYLLYSTADAGTYHAWKELLLPYTDFQKDGIPLWVANQGPEYQLALFQQKPLYTLSQLVAGLEAAPAQWKFKPIEKVWEQQSLNTAYTKDNYLAAFEALRAKGKVELLNGKTLQPIRRATYSTVIKQIA